MKVTCYSKKIFELFYSLDKINLIGSFRPGSFKEGADGGKGG